MAPTRRGLLAGIAALAPVVSAMPLATLPAAPDAVLLALCDRFHALHAEAEATDPDVDADLTDALNRRQEVQHEIQLLRALTPAGQAAKARVAMHLLDEAFGPRWPGDFLDFGLATLAEIAGVDVPAANPESDEPAVVAAPAVFPDTELLAACAGADAVQRRMDALYRGPTRVEDDKERDALLKPLSDEQEPFLEQVVELRAQTLAGHRARARTLLGWDKAPPSVDEFYYWNDGMVAALLRDLGREAGA